MIQNEILKWDTEMRYWKNMSRASVSYTLSWPTQCPQIWQPRWNGTIPWRTLSAKSHIRRNRLSEQAYASERDRIRNYNLSHHKALGPAGFPGKMLSKHVGRNYTNSSQCLPETRNQGSTS